MLFDHGVEYTVYPARFTSTHPEVQAGTKRHPELLNRASIGGST